MTNFEKITSSPEVLGEFLASLPVATGPWDEEFHRAFCDSCEQLECRPETCPHKGNRPLWWLVQTTESEQDTRRAAWTWSKGRVDLGPGVIIPLENHLRVIIRAERIENPFGEMQTGKEMSTRLETAWQAAEEVKRVHPNAEISVEVEV